MTAARPVVIGCDPGGTTGFGTYVGGVLTAVQVSATDAVPWLRGWLVAFHVRYPERQVFIATERYIKAPGAKHSVQNDAADVNAGISNLVAELNDGTTWLILTYQNAGDAKKCADNALLRLLGFDQPGKSHAADAVRHALLRLLSRFPAEFLRVRNGRYASVNTPELEAVPSGVR